MRNYTQNKPTRTDRHGDIETQTHSDTETYRYRDKHVHTRIRVDATCSAHLDLTSSDDIGNAIEHTARARHTAH